MSPGTARLLVVSLWAAALAGLSASRGLNEDHVISLNAALRHLAGQLPYRDYAVPHGPLAGLLLTPVLALPIPAGWGFVLGTALLNAAAAVLTSALVRAVSAERPAWAAGLLSGAWFLPAFGAYYHDHVAYVFVLGAIGAALVPTPRRALVAGLLLALAYHAKQSFGVAGLLALAGVDLVARGRAGLVLSRRLAWAVGGLAAGHLLVLGPIALTGGLPTWWRYAVQVPAEFAAEPAQGKSAWNFALAAVWPFKISPTLAQLRGTQADPILAALFVPVQLLVMSAYALLAWLWFRRVRAPRAARWLTVAVVVIIVSGAVALTLQPDLRQFGAGRQAALFLAAAGALLVAGGFTRGQPLAPPAVALAFLLVSTLACAANAGRHCTELALGLPGVLALGVWLTRPSWLLLLTLAFTAVALESARRDRFRAYDLRPLTLRTPGPLAPLPRLYLAEGRPYPGAEDYRLNDADLNALLDELRAQPPRRLAVCDDKGFFLPLMLGQADWSWPLYSHDGLTVPHRLEWREQWQREFLERLDAAGVDCVVWSLDGGLRDLRVPPDPNGFLDERERAAPLPILTDGLAARFREVGRFGSFRVFRR